MVTSMRGSTNRALRKKHNLPQQMSFPKPTWNFCETSMLFQTSGYYMYCRGYVVLQTSNRAKLEKNQEIVTCLMYVPSTCTETVVCTGHGAGQFSCEDSFRCMWPMTHALITRLSSRAFSVNSSSCSKSQGQRAVHQCWWAAGNPVDVRRHSTRYCLATAV